MKKIILLILITTTIGISSCVTTLQPLVTRNTIISDDRLIGAWNNDDQEFIVQGLFNSNLYKKNKDEIEKEKQKNGGKLNDEMRRDSLYFSKIYVIEYSKDGIKYELLGGLIKLNGQFFINFKAEEMTQINSAGNEYNFNLPNRIASNTIARLQFSGSNMIKLDFIDGGYIYDQIKTGHMKIKHEKDDMYDTFLITASSEELQQFLKKYGNDKRFFNKENSVTLIRKS